MGLRFALSGEVSQNVRAMSNTEQDALQNHHKEEADGRIKADRADRLSLRNTLDVHINPLHDVSHPDGALMNIVTCRTNRSPWIRSAFVLGVWT